MIKILTGLAVALTLASAATAATQSPFQQFQFGISGTAEKNGQSYNISGGSFSEIIVTYDPDDLPSSEFTIGVQTAMQTNATDLHPTYQGPLSIYGFWGGPLQAKLLSPQELVLSGIISNTSFPGQASQIELNFDGTWNCLGQCEIPWLFFTGQPAYASGYNAVSGTYSLIATPLPAPGLMLAFALLGIGYSKRRSGSKS